MKVLVKSKHFKIVDLDKFDSVKVVEESTTNKNADNGTAYTVYAVKTASGGGSFLGSGEEKEWLTSVFSESLADEIMKDICLNWGEGKPVYEIEKWFKD
ncbi:hypothetical protein OBV_p-00560 (plasmid) [Oscillibacter valericigenes Sjm18-20]|nr:hypothetical protein OBV_p-00560 [Oscillibacter valericigenes Sjm18-20]